MPWGIQQIWFLSKNNLKCGKKASFQEMLIILNQAESESQTRPIDS